MADETKAVEESAKAVQEVAKTTGKALEIVEKAGPFVERVFGPSIESAVGLLSDRLQHYRLRQFFKLADKTDALLQERGIEVTRHVPPSLAIPLIEAATIEERDTLHDLWAELLANAMDPDFDEEIRPAFVTILKDISPLDAIILKFFCDGGADGAPYMNKMEVLTGRLAAQFRATERDCEIAVGNLIRLGCLSPARDTSGAYHHLTSTGDSTAPLLITITPLGRALVRACMK